VLDFTADFLNRFPRILPWLIISRGNTLFDNPLLAIGDFGLRGWARGCATHSSILRSL
jgi:hypothetical protein